jgi:DNA-binding PadR family transcriptional regulator
LITVTPPLFYILLSIRDRERHGYEILKEVQTGSLGKVRLGPATLYTSLKKMLDARLIQEVSGPRDGDPRRRYYRLTARGRLALEDELNRMEQAIRLARRRTAKVAT